MYYETNRKLIYLIYLFFTLTFLISCFFNYYPIYSCYCPYMLDCVPIYEYSVNGFEVITFCLGFPFGLIGLILIFLSNIFIYKLKIDKALLLGITGCIFIGIILIYLPIFIDNHSIPKICPQVSVINLIEFGYILGFIAWIALCGTNMGLLIFRVKRVKPSNRTKK